MNALAACHRARRAWEASQPQLFLELWPDSGLDEPQPSALRFVEPHGLTGGAEPHSDLLRTDGVPFAFGVPSRVALPRARGGSAPSTNQTGPDATPRDGARPALGGGV